jgi:hypothetical protein
MTKFLSKENFEHVLGVCIDYLVNAVKVQVDEKELQVAIAREMKRIASSVDKDTPVDAMNKMVIVAIREIVTSPPPPPSAPHPPVTPPVQSSPDPPSQILKDDEVLPSDESAFFKNLKNIEIQRSIAIQPPTGDVAVATATPSTTPPPVSQPSTVIIKNSNKIIQKKSVILPFGSFNRLWMYESQRNPFIANVDFPKNFDTSRIKLNRVIMPPGVLHTVPYYCLNIEGAAKTSVSIPLVVATKNSERKEVELVCPSPDACYIPPLSMPWTITLFDCYKRTVDVGYDGWTISVKLTPTADISVYMLVNTMHDRCDTSFSAGDVIEVHTGADKTSIHTVFGVKKHSIEILGACPDTGYIINLTQQTAVFLEIDEKNDNTSLKM